jgi:hypothetical protein
VSIKVRAIHDRARGFFTLSSRSPARLSATQRVRNKPETFRMTLSPEQKEQVRRATGKDAEVIELSVEELEERIAPGKTWSTNTPGV